jgi:hypothetical protein
MPRADGHESINRNGCRQCGGAGRIVHAAGPCRVTGSGSTGGMPQ